MAKENNVPRCSNCIHGSPCALGNDAEQLLIQAKELYFTDESFMVTIDLFDKALAAGCKEHIHIDVLNRLRNGEV